MAGYDIRILDGAARELARLDKPLARRIVERSRWLAGNLSSVRPELLTGDLAGLFKLRVGDYRIIYELLHEERAVVIHAIGQPQRDLPQALSGAMWGELSVCAAPR